MRAGVGAGVGGAGVGTVCSFHVRFDPSQVLGDFT